jgi:hypothetical protein
MHTDDKLLRFEYVGMQKRSASSDAEDTHLHIKCWAFGTLRRAQLPHLIFRQ